MRRSRRYLAPLEVPPKAHAFAVFAPSVCSLTLKIGFATEDIVAPSVSNVIYDFEKIVASGCPRVYLTFHYEDPSCTRTNAGSETEQAYSGTPKVPRGSRRGVQGFCVW